MNGLGFVTGSDVELRLEDLKARSRILEERGRGVEVCFSFFLQKNVFKNLKSPNFCFFPSHLLCN